MLKIVPRTHFRFLCCTRFEEYLKSLWVGLTQRIKYNKKNFLHFFKSLVEFGPFLNFVLFAQQSKRHFAAFDCLLFMLYKSSRAGNYHVVGKICRSRCLIVSRVYKCMFIYLYTRVQTQRTEVVENYWQRSDGLVLARKNEHETAVFVRVKQHSLESEPLFSVRTAVFLNWSASKVSLPHCSPLHPRLVTAAISIFCLYFVLRGHCTR